MEELKKKDDQSIAPEIVEQEQLATEFPLSGGETDQDFDDAIKSIFSSDEEKEKKDEDKQD